MSIIQFYLGCKRQYHEAERVLTTCFELQWVGDLLSDSIRRAGFTPCLGIDQLQVIDRRHNQRIDALKIENKAHQFIQVNRMSEHFAKVMKMQNPSQIGVQNSVRFHAKRPILIADCEHGEVHELLNIEQHTDESLITLNKPLRYSYDTASTYVGEFFEERWFIKSNVKGHKPTLYYQLTQTEEVTSVIHSLHTKQDAQNKRFLELSLGLKDDKTHQLIVTMRGS
jgi:hypothetical protein